MRPLFVLIPALLAWPAALMAQVCSHGRPKPACSAFVVTNFGGYLLVGHDDWGDGPWREVADRGALVNVNLD